MELNEARKALEASLGEELKQKYFALLRQWFEFSSPITKDEFDKNVRKLLVNETQIRYHNQFILGILMKQFHNKTSSAYDYDYSDYNQPASPMLLPSDVEYRSAADELFIPDSGFISSRIAVSAWENGMNGAEEKVTEVIVYACQMFIKNIITAMVSKKKGYKIRDGKLQYGFNQPIPDPFLRNYANVTDTTQESKVTTDEDSFMPRYRESYENIEQQVAFAYSCSKRKKCDNMLTVQLLHDTLRDNPTILGLHSIQSVNTFKLGLHE